MKNCDFTRIFPRLNRIIEHSQIGKTTALVQYTAEHVDTYLITLHPSTSTTSLIRLLSGAMGCKTHIAPDIALAELSARLTTNSLIIVDEAHQVAHRPSGVAAMEFLRALHDQAKCGVLICGTYQLEKWMRSSKAAETLIQLTNRGTTEYLRSYPERRDLDSLADSYNMPTLTDAAYEYAYDIIKRDGLGPYCRELERAVYIANRQDREADWQFVTDMMDRLADERVAALNDRQG